VQLRRNAKVDLLATVPLFSGCSKRELGEIAQHSDEIDVPQGRKIITEGALGREFFVIIHGSAHVSRKGHRIRELGAGDWAGEIALISDVPRSATVTTASETRLLVLTARDFRRLLDTSPSIAAKILRVLGERLEAMTA
jgi:CRP/FNR family cyclic AMP-dependent transcriptional regulator